MGELAMDRTETTRVEAILRDELAGGDRALRSLAPVIGHLLQNSGPSMISDAVVARLRGMLGDLARQLLQASLRPVDQRPPETPQIDALADNIAADSALLDHLYALAMEGYLTQQLEATAGIDPVLSPLLQELIASDQPATAELAMSTLAAQSRFLQCQSRMELPLSELPAELFTALLSRFEAHIDSQNGANVGVALQELRHSYDEGVGRFGLLQRLVNSMGGAALAALSLEHAGLALFVSALATLTKQERSLAVLTCHERQSTRLALSLRAAGLEREAIESQLILLGGAGEMPRDLGAIAPERARDLIGGGAA